MTTRERVADFLFTLNAVCFCPFLFPLKNKKHGDGFVLEVKEELIGGIGIFFVEGNKRHPILIRRWDCSYMSDEDFQQSLEDKWKIAWKDLIRHILLAEDCIGKLKNANTDADLNILSFKTIANEGLKHIK